MIQSRLFFSIAHNKLIPRSEKRQENKLQPVIWSLAGFDVTMEPVNDWKIYTGVSAKQNSFQCSFWRKPNNTVKYLLVNGYFNYLQLSLFW